MEDSEDFGQLFEEVQINSEDEDYSDYPACGTTGDPKHKVGGVTSKKTEVSTTTTTKDTCGGCECSEVEVECEATIKKERKLCYKCKEVPAVYKSRQDFICKGCLETHIDHKFKACLRLKLNVTRHDKVLICVSGGANSLAMSHLVSSALNTVNGKKMFFQAELLFIDESVLLDGEDKEKKRESSLTRMKEMASQLKLKLTVLSLTDIYIGVSAEEATAKLRKLLDSFKPVGSNQEDFVAFFKTQIYLEYAYRNGFEKVLLGQCGQRLASKIFTLFAKGRAASADNEIQFIDNIDISVFNAFFDGKEKGDEVTESAEKKRTSIIICRPMKDFLNKEIMNYLHCVGILDKLLDRQEYLCERESANQRLPGNGNIDRIMENFIDKIQENFVSTTHTILHTSEKLIKKFPVQEGRVQRCPLCMQFRDKVSNVLEIETFDASLSHDLIKSEMITSEASLKLQYLNSEKVRKADARELILCFGCRRIISSKKSGEFRLFDSNLLPEQITKRAQHIADIIPREQLF